MQPRRRQSLTDILVAWGLLVSLVGIFGLGCFEAFKVFAVIPAAFDSSPMVWSNPMMPSDGDQPPNQSGQTRMTSQQRARAAQQGR
jgi:hypothetical protein